MNPVVRELGVPPAVLRRLAARLPAHYPMLLDSAAEGPLSRTSVLVAEPRAALWLDAEGQLGAEGIAIRGNTFFTALESWWLAEREATSNAHAELPFTGGWAIYLGYEMAQEVEPRLRLPRATLPWRAFALRAPGALVHDRTRQRVIAVAEADSADLLDRLEADAYRAAQEPDASDDGLRVKSIGEEDPDAYLERVRRAKEYVRAGDIYQTNLSRPWHVEVERDPDVAALYNRLCTTNPAPFAALAQWRGAAIISSSPERLVRLEGGRIDTRPIAGTRPRSRRRGDDIAQMTALAAHPKERAEHIMLIDLERNDLGRVCEAGTVRVDEFMTIESYAHVHHIVSNLSGVLRPDVTPIEALRAVFPGGTITGVPKFRCMQIIAELEGVGRGAYTGSLGYLNRNGTMDLNILIRTMTLMGRKIEFRAGAGIVADSEPQRELAETRAKAR
ncbi:MAG: aminodeoxychorismate synthase component I, partial [Steroidobacteraceae bacterium]